VEALNSINSTGSKKSNQTLGLRKRFYSYRGNCGWLESELSSAARRRMEMEFISFMLTFWHFKHKHFVPLAERKAEGEGKENNNNKQVSLDLHKHTHTHTKTKLSEDDFCVVKEILFPSHKSLCSHDLPYANHFSLCVSRLSLKSLILRRSSCHSASDSN